MTDPAHGGSPRQRFRSRLAARPLLVDGGLGTLLFSRGVPQRACLEELVTTHPEMVGAAHREYLEAGAELIETLSFGANRDAWRPGVSRARSPTSTGAPHGSPAKRAKSVAATRSSVARSGHWVADARRAADRGRRGAGRLPRADRRPARGRRGPDRPRDLLGPGAARAGGGRGSPRVGPPGHRLADIRRGARAGRRQQPGRGRGDPRPGGSRRDRRQLRSRPGGLSRRARGDGRPRRWRPRAVDHAQRRPVAAARGPVRLRRQRRVFRHGDAPSSRGRRPDRRRLLRHDARAHRRDAGRARRGGGGLPGGRARVDRDGARRTTTSLVDLVVGDG